MERFFLLTLMIFGLAACKEKKPELIPNSASSYEISTEKWPQKLEVNPQAQEILEDWDEYNSFETSFDALYKVANRDDLSLTIEDLIAKQNTLKASKYPEDFDRPQVKGRQKVFETYMMKVKGDIHYRIDPRESVIELITAYNAFRNQFNVILNNRLDTDLLLEEF